MRRGIILTAQSPGQDWYRFKMPLSQMEGVEAEVYPYKLTDDNPQLFASRLIEWMASPEGFEPDFVWAANSSIGAQVLCDVFRNECGAEIIGEADDLFTEVPPGNMAYGSWQGDRKRRYLDFLVNETDRLIVSTPYLGSEFGGLVAPNFIIDVEWAHPARTTRKLDEVVICCPYGNGRAGDYLTIETALKSALAIPHVKVVFMGSMPYWATEYPVGKVVYCSWVPIEQYPQMMAWMKPDVIVSPMERHNFNLAKSNLKWLEAGAVGSCFVGEKWGEYERTIEDGETGVLCDSLDEWTEKLTWMCGDHAERKRIAANGRRDVLTNWTWSAVEEHWRHALLGEVSDGNSRDRRMVAS